MRRRLIPIAVVALVAGLLVYEVVSAGPSSGQARPAPPLPSTVLQPPKTTLATLRGRPALVNFWASWCEPCREEAPEIERLARSLKGGDAALVGVDYTDQPGAARAFIRRYHWTFPILSDPDGTAGARFRFSGLPTTVVLDSRGRIVETLRGPQDVRSLHEALSAAEAD